MRLNTSASVSPSSMGGLNKQKKEEIHWAIVSIIPNILLEVGIYLVNIKFWRKAFFLQNTTGTRSTSISTKGRKPLFCQILLVPEVLTFFTPNVHLKDQPHNAMI
jgi:hypothetical protein